MSPAVLVGIVVLISSLVTLVLVILRARQLQKGEAVPESGAIDVPAGTSETLLRTPREFRRLFMERSREWPLKPDPRERKIFAGVVDSGEQGQKILQSIRDKKTPPLSILPFVYKRLEYLLEKVQGFKSARTGEMEWGGYSEPANKIKADQAMSAAILRKVNSHIHEKTSDIEFSLNFLGPHKVIKVLSKLKPLDELAQYEGVIPPFKWKQFWRHSTNVAIASELLAGQLRPEASMDSWICGLIHDIGKLVLFYNFPEEYPYILQKNLINHSNLLDTEYEQLNSLTHSEVGALAAAEWNWPDFLVSVIKFHHYPWLMADWEGLGVIVHLANSVVLANGLGNSGNFYSHALGEQVRFLIAVDSEAEVGDILTELHNEVEPLVRANRRAEIF